MIGELVTVSRRVLVIEDDMSLRRLVIDVLDAAGFECESAGDGEEGWRMLAEHPGHYGLVLLDRRLPLLDGLQILHRIKQEPQIRDVPVVFMSGLNSEKQIADGIEAGAYYYVTKPFPPLLLVTIVRAALENFTAQRVLRAELESSINAVSLLASGVFRFRHLSEARALAGLLAKCCARPAQTVTGLWELLLNAIEHGNLNITYAEKSQLIEGDGLRAEIERRLATAEYNARQVEVEVAREGQEVLFTIRDDGAGFNPERYLDFDPARATHAHGRGIAMARSFSFKRVEYLGNGNVVRASADGA